MSEPMQPPVEATTETFYLTTPIYYVNARPHVGHAYSTIVADVLARRHRVLGHDTYFLTGTDEHGQKIERSAAAAGVPPQEFADRVSKTFSDLWERMGITNDDFIRTTDPRHKQGVQKLFQTLYDRGHIYLSTYTGQYSIGEEMFVDGPPGTIGPDGRPTETVTEENFFFRLSVFQGSLFELIESDRLKISPESSKNEVLSFVRGGLKDLSVSRSSFTWGIPVPEQVQKQAGATQHHVIYVWLDALANYMTAIGYGSDDEADKAKFEKYWPANLHVVGKEITRFHCVYWPAFLLAAGLPTPGAITANGWLLFDNSKMSKSKGNVVRTETILDAFGEHVYKKQFPDSTKEEQDLFAADVLRYYLLREIPFGQDGSFSFEAMVARYNADLANGYGNLVSRTLNLIEQNFSGVLQGPNEPWLCTNPQFDFEDDEPKTMDEAFSGTATIIREICGFEELWSQMLFMNRFQVAIAELLLRIRYVDSYLSWNKPWKLAKLDDSGSRAKLVEVLYVAAEAIRVLTALLYPILPCTTMKVWSQLGLGDLRGAADKLGLRNLRWGDLQPGTKLGPLAPIFPRADKSVPQFMMEMEVVTPPLAEDAKDGAPGVGGDITVMPTEDSSQDPALPMTHTAEPFKEYGAAVAVVEPKDDPTHPAAPPRTASLPIPNPGATVGGSHAVTTEREGTPPHGEAQASGIFSSTAGSETPQIGIDDFTKIDLRVARIVVAERIPKADKLLRLEVDLGYEQRQILSGIAEHYTPEELIGRKIVIIANLAPRKMRGLESRGMLLAASEGENGRPVLATFGEEIAVGTRLR